MSESIVPGDWVRFFKDGHCVIGLVEYHAKDFPWKEPRLITDAGEVRVDAVLEVRHAEAKP
jgi:hypothetical protein